LNKFAGTRCWRKGHLQCLFHKRLALSVGNPVQRFIDRTVQARIEAMLHNGELYNVFEQPNPQKAWQPELEPII
jgi:hypothetical protein